MQQPNSTVNTPLGWILKKKKNAIKRLQSLIQNHIQERSESARERERERERERGRERIALYKSDQ